MVDETTLEIWNQFGLSCFGERNVLGEVPLDPEVKSFIDQNVSLKRNDRVACLSNFRIYHDNRPSWNDMWCDMDFLVSQFSWHYGLNKPVTVKDGKPSLNKAVQDKYPNRHEIGLTSGVLPIGIMAITLTKDEKFLLGVRNPAATHTVGDFCLVPAGFCSLDRKGSTHNEIIENTTGREFLEEVLYEEGKFSQLSQKTVDMLVAPHASIDGIYGLTYVDQATNRGFGLPVLIRTEFDSQCLDEFLKARNPDPEHKGYLLREFSRGSIEDLVKKRGKAIEIHSLGALMIAAKEYQTTFSSEYERNRWFERMVNEVVPQNYGRIMTLPENTFDERRNVVEVIKETMPQRYPS